MSFGSDRMFISRLKTAFNQKKHITFLLGSGCSLSNNPVEKGVPGVSEIITQIEQIFEKDGQLDIITNTLANDKVGNKYQIAMNTLLQCYGQDEVNKVIVNAVFNCRSSSVVFSEENYQADKLEEIEKDVLGWNLQSGMASLGKLLVEYPKTFKSPVLTTNFDPLIEISILKNRGMYSPNCLTNDGNILNSANSAVAQIVHLHGFWRHGDTLHSPSQLTKERPLLKGDLRKLLNNSILVVLGYGGWGDVFTNTLIDVITENNENFNVLWTFFQQDEKAIYDTNGLLLEKLKNAIDQRVVLYKGIDFNLVIPELYTIVSKNVNGLQSDVALKPTEENNAVPKAANELRKKSSAYQCDAPPINPLWVGRSEEIRILKEANYKACFITGIGGQGKSGLASHFIQSHCNAFYDFWDWRDCKEEDNRFSTIMINLIERLTNGKFVGYQLANESIGNIIDLFFAQLGDAKAVFVFDNIDNYIDIVDFYPTRGIKEFLDKILTIDHKSKFIFTCRPEINSSSADMAQIMLKDLSLFETKELFTKINCSLDVSDKEAIAEKAHALTQGHPLWLSLIGAQVYKGKEAALTFIDEINNSKSTNFQNPSTVLAVKTLEVVWKLLGSKQEILMRGLAESVAPETERHLRDILSSELNDNQFFKALNSVKKMNLIVIKTTEFGEDLYELHPLVKEFILFRFPKNERSRFITLFVNYYDRIILLVKKAPDPTSSLSFFQNWTNKIELEVNKENYQSALATLHEISDSIITAGYIEEYQRVATRLFIEIDFPAAIGQEMLYFDEQINFFAKSLSEVGKYSESEAFLTKFLKSIDVKGTKFINLFNTFAYHYWCKKDYRSSIEYSERALELINNSNLPGGQDASYNLALALRDSLEIENVRKALNIFALGEDIEKVILNLDNGKEQSASHYGNIGRSLWYLNEKSNALKFYIKSLQRLKNEMAINSKINRGFATAWILEALIELNDFKQAYYFYRFNLKCWESTAPLKMQETEKKYSQYFTKMPESILNITDWEIEKNCYQFSG